LYLSCTVFFPFFLFFRNLNSCRLWNCSNPCAIENVENYPRKTGTDALRCLGVVLLPVPVVQLLSSDLPISSPAYKDQAKGNQEKGKKDSCHMPLQSKHIDLQCHAPHINMVITINIDLICCRSFAMGFFLINWAYAFSSQLLACRRNRLMLGIPAA